jgi:hypothetical protein
MFAMLMRTVWMATHLHSLPPKIQATAPGYISHLTDEFAMDLDKSFICPVVMSLQQQFQTLQKSSDALGSIAGKRTRYTTPLIVHPTQMY